MNLETAGEDGKLTQSFEPEALPIGGGFTDRECAPPIERDSGPKPCINLPSPTAVSRLNKYLIRFNKTRGQQGRGTLDHVWRVFENEKEYILKHVKINVSSHSEKSEVDWNIACFGVMEIDRATSTATINPQ